MAARNTPVLVLSAFPISGPTPVSNATIIEEFYDPNYCPSS